MRVRIATLVGASLALLNTACPSTYGCDPPSKKFNLDEDLTADDVATIVDDYGLASANDIECNVACTHKFREVDGWETSSVDTCTHEIDTSATPAGHVSCGGTAIEYYCEGRRPLGWIAPVAAEPTTMVEQLVELARLEAASVLSFERLATRLLAWRAPPELVARCRAAAREERRHARAVTELARARGFTGTVDPGCSGTEEASVFDEALHNASEGCVAETWAALLAGVRAERARDPDVRECYARIAVDEVRHAQLAWDLHTWFRSRSSASERARLDARRRAALVGLGQRAANLAGSLPPALGGLSPGQARWLAESFASQLRAVALDFMETILKVRPDVIAHDLHPGYLSTTWAEVRAAQRRIAVQHHHAHVASAMAEHGLAGPVIGVAYDGTGWGTDGTAWGGEILLARFDDYERLATFRAIPLPGGEAAIRAPWRIALALLEDAFDGHPPLDRLPLFAAIDGIELENVYSMLHVGLNAPRARGVGRYFDGIAALGLARASVRHEGQLALAWNTIAAPDEPRPYPWSLDRSASVTEIDLRPMVRAVVADVIEGVPAAVIAARFHETLVAATAAVVAGALRDHGSLPVVLTGGCFQNPRLAEGMLAALAGADVRLHGEVPPGDGGLALGQAMVADAVTRRTS